MKMFAMLLVLVSSVAFAAETKAVAPVVHKHQHHKHLKAHKHHKKPAPAAVKK